MPSDGVGSADQTEHPTAHSEDDRIVAKSGDSVIEGEWREMKQLAQEILTEAESHKTDLEKVEEMAAGVHVRLSCENCDYEEEQEYVSDLYETPEEHVEHPDFDCNKEDVTVEAFCPRHGVVPLEWDECDSCASNRAMMNR